MNALIGITGFLLAAWILGKVSQAFAGWIDEFLQAMDEMEWME